MSDISLGQGGADRRRGTVYPSPFFDIAQTYMPPTVKELFRWCAYFFYKDPMIGSVVTKMAEYPVTDFVYNAEEKHVRDGWKELMEDTLNLKPFLIEIGLDFFCFHGDTKVTTRNGVFKLRELAGQTVDVLSDGGTYRPAEFKSFGRQKLLEVEFNDGRTVLATPEHQWVVTNSNGKTVRVPTTELSGKRILRNVAPRPEQNADFYEGVRHGFVFGDGCLYNDGKQAKAYFYGEKDLEMLKYFEGHGSPAIKVADGTVMVHGLPIAYKELPPNANSASYWYGFLCGFLAADGSVDVNGCAVLTQKAKATLDAVADQLPRIGMIAGQVRGYERSTSFKYGEKVYEYEGAMHFLSLFKQYLLPQDFLLSRHRSNFEENYKPTRYGSYVHIKDVRETGLVDEVFCCVEMETHTFTIDNGVLTGNCYGNAFISINLPFVRWLQCTGCKSLHRLSDPAVEYKFQNFGFNIKCQDCGISCVAKIVDKPLRDRSGINFVRWDPKNIDIHYNPITGRSKYRYKIPNKIQKAIQGGERAILVDIPEIFLQALKQKRDIALSDQNLFHFKRPTLAEADMGWGKPLIIHSMGRMFYLYVLRRAQEAIALQRIMPLEFIFPQANAQQDPYQHVNLSSWQGTVQNEIRKWRTDPNYISVVAVPLGFERLGGDGRALLLGPEIEVTNKEITGGMGVPLEFVFGGLSWSGSSVSLRTLENHFLMHRRLLLRFVNWAKNRIRLYLGLPDIEIGFTEFKMADDIQRKQIVIQLNAANKISDHTMLTELGFDYDDELKMIEKEADQRNRIQAVTMKAQSEAQGEASIVQAKYQARAQEAMNEASGGQSGGQPGQGEQGQGQMQQGDQQPQAQPQEGQPQMAQDAPSADQQAADQQMGQQAALQGAAQLPANVEGETGTSAGGQVVQMDASKVAKNWANRIAQLPPDQREGVLNDLRQKMPNMARLVEQLLAQMQTGETAGQAEDRNKPAPQMAPPRRGGGAV